MKREVTIGILITVSQLLCAEETLRTAFDNQFFSVGMKAEMNVTSINPTHNAPVTDVPGLGATVGPFIFFNVSDAFALEMDLLVHYKSSSVVYNRYEFLYQQVSLEVPVYFLYQHYFNRGGRFYVGGGPYGEFGYIAQLSENGYFIDLYKKDEETEISSMNDFSAGFGAIGGYECPFHLQIYVTGKISITNMVFDNKKPFGLYPCVFSVGIAYRIVSK